MRSVGGRTRTVASDTRTAGRSARTRPRRAVMGASIASSPLPPGGRLSPHGAAPLVGTGPDGPVRQCVASGGRTLSGARYAPLRPPTSDPSASLRGYGLRPCALPRRAPPDPRPPGPGPRAADPHLPHAPSAGRPPGAPRRGLAFPGTGDQTAGNRPQPQKGNPLRWGRRRRRYGGTSATHRQHTADSPCVASRGRPAAADGAPVASVGTRKPARAEDSPTPCVQEDQARPTADLPVARPRGTSVQRLSVRKILFRM